MTGVLWVVLAALLFGVGSLAQARGAAPAPRSAPVAGIAAIVRDPWFLLGTAAEGLGALAHLAALQSVSMTVAQLTVTGGLAVTAVGARLLWGHRLGARGGGALAALAAALVALAAVGGTGSAGTGSSTPAVVELASAVVVLALVGGAAVVGRVRHRGAVLATVSGLGFAACSVASRLLDTSTVLATLVDPMLLVLAAAGALGAAGWVLALREAEVTTVTAIVVVAEVVPASLLGPLLGDVAGSAFWLVAPPALLVSVAAGVVLARREPTGEPRPAAAEPGRPPQPVPARSRPRPTVDPCRPPTCGSAPPSPPTWARSRASTRTTSTTP